MLIDFYAHYYSDPHHKNEVEVEDEDFDLEDVLAEMEANPEAWEAV